MYQRILIPTDGSREAEYAVPFAAAIAARTGGRLVLLRASPEPYLVPNMPLSLKRTTAHIAARELDAVCDRWQDAGVPIETRLRAGFPVAEILRAAPQFDLIVMSTHGLSGLKRFMMGSVAERIIRLAPIPLLAVRPEGRWTRASAEAAAARMFRDVCVPLDGSPTARQALRDLRKFPLDEARLRLVHILPREASAQAEDFAGADLADSASWFEARGVTVVRSVERDDQPARGIAAVAGRGSCGMIAMTTHGSSRLKEVFLGGTADRLFHFATVPLLVSRVSRPLWKRGRRPLGRRAVAAR
jgi:nucleotide-binding universal stress UspA family protein